MKKMGRIKLTAKRQATLPVAVCEELGVGPGDELELERRTVDGDSVWLLRVSRPDWSWFGAARVHAKGKSHDWARIEESIARGFARGRRS